jgi:hypothetical protein
VASDQTLGQNEVSTSPVAAAPPAHPAATDEEARLQAELILRQIAEEEFQRRLQNAEADTVQQTPPSTIGTSASGNGDVADIEGAIVTDGSAADEASQVFPITAQQTGDAEVGTDDNGAMQPPPQANDQTLQQ